MKRIDLTEPMLDRIIKELSADVEMKVNDLLSLLGSVTHKPKIVLTPFSLVIQIFKYASADQALMHKLNLYEFEKYCPNDDITELVSCLFLPATRLDYSPDIPIGFWDTPLGFVCKVASARGSLDSYMPLTVMELATLADRKHTTVQQHCQRGSIKAIKEKKSWKISPVHALEYLKSVQSEPFHSYYDEEQYKSDLKNWLNNGTGSYLNEGTIKNYYNNLD